MIRIGGMIVGVVLAVTAVGCGSSSKGEDVPATVTYNTLDDFCTAIGKAECNKQLTDACLVSTDTCVAAVKDACRNGKMDVTQGLNTEAYNPAKASDCIDAVTGAYGSGNGVVIITSDGHAAVKKKCDPVFSQLKSAGLTCAVDNDCDVNLICYFGPDDTDVGHCATAMPTGAGQLCTMAGAQCPSGMRCTKADHICGVIVKNVGDACAGGDPCPMGVFCDPTMGMSAGTGTCFQPQDSGADCALDGECSSNYCAQIGMKHQCVPQVSIGTASPFCPNFGASM